VGDRRKELADEVQSGLLFLAKIEDDKYTKTYSAEEIAFLQKDIRIDTNKLIPELIPVVNSRIDEIKKGLNALMPLSVIILSGSTLECILLNLAKRDSESFNKAKFVPKDKDKKVLSFSSWKLQSFIDVATELDYLNVDIRVFCHGLRNFRNYVHPNVQLKNEFSPDMHTAEICYQVLKAAIFDVCEKLEALRNNTI
jgi:hypothetical protein